MRPGGWAFQYANPHYPDLDDTAVVGDGAAPLRCAALSRADRRAAREWVEGMQSRNGGWGAFDADNTYYYLNHIPFADHGALLDPPTADVSARCVGMLAQLGEAEDSPAVDARASTICCASRKADGSWFGRWGTNYIYGTWSVLCALKPRASTKSDADDPQRAVAWLVSKQRADGGWGEDGDSYWLDSRAASTRPAPPRRPPGRCSG